MKHSRILVVLVAVGILAAGTVIAGGSVHRDVFLGKGAGASLSGGDSVTVRNDNASIIYLSQVSGILEGWADNNPGFNAEDGSAPGVEPMDDGAALFFEVRSFSPAFHAYDQVFNDLHQAGDSAELGGNNLHVHYTWHIKSDDVNFDPERTGWRAQYRVNDFGTTEYGTAADAFFFRPDAVANVIPGDADQNGVLSPFDVQAFWAVVAAPGSATMQQRAACDVNHDGVVSGDDAGGVMQLLKGVRLF